MNKKILVLMALILALHAIPQYYVGAATLPGLIPLEMGYSASSLMSIDKGIPVYTVNDELWARTTNNATAKISLIPPDSPEPVAERTIELSTVTRLYRFTNTNEEGIWHLLFESKEMGALSSDSVPFLLVNPGIHDVEPRLSNITLESGNITLSFTLNTVYSYDLEAYVVSKETERAAFVQIPSNLGSGQLSINKTGSHISISRNGTLVSSVDFWLELYHPYSYSNPETNGLVSREIRVAASEPVLILPQSETVVASLDEETPLRSGRYTIRSFFRSASGLSVTESKALLTDDSSWIWLEPSSIISISSASFSVVSSLSSSATFWPRGIYVMHRVIGVESLSYLSLGIGIASASFVSFPWGADVKVTPSPNEEVRLMDYFNDTLYLVAEAFPLQVNYTLSLGDASFDSGSVTFNEPFIAEKVALEVGELSVRVVRGGRGARGVTVELSSEYGGRINRTTDDNGYATFHVPQGFYIVDASQGADSQNQRAFVENSRSTFVIIDLGAFEDVWFAALLIVASIGIAANIWIWLIKPYPKTRIRY